MTVIAVDDETGALKVLNKAVADVMPGEKLNCFSDSYEALDFAVSNGADIAFLDIQMPGLSGLELAKQLKKINPFVNVIFTTGFSDYAVDAIRMRSSGYLLKPITKADVRTELDHLRYPVQTQNNSGIRVKTFGFFDVFVDGSALTFRREKAKEMLAYLVDRRGSLVTRKELAAVIFEDREYTRTTQTYLTQIISNLRKTLEEAGVSELLCSDYNAYGVNTDCFSCDAYDYLDGDAEAVNQFHGEYMSQYSWSENCRYQFYE